MCVMSVIIPAFQAQAGAGPDATGAAVQGNGSRDATRVSSSHTHACT